MRYQFVLLPALASLAFAQDDTLSVSDNPAPTPDALPIDDLRDIPVPTFTVVTGVTAQDIPYATASAIADVTSAVAETPLSVFPAATDVPINAAGAEDIAEEDDASAHVISNSNTKVKRDLLGVARQPRKRAACGDEPTVPNFHSVDVSTAAAFRADAKIADVANGANSAPAGYYQNFKNLKGSVSTMNYLGYTVIKSGEYDVDFCAAKCTAKAGCFAFNIFFERNPKQNPGADCRNPDAFANMKCTFWGTALTEKLASNKGQWREKFEVAIAGSNGYTSYKLGNGPVDGYTAPQELGNAVMQAPLYDCTSTWSYLGYRLLQAGSVDPRLCSAACEKQTEINTEAPAKNADGTLKPAVTCNAFGSYILTKTNATGTYQQGQMCTFYTANWDKKFALSTASGDASIGAKYTFSYSTFYGRVGKQPTCGTEFVSASGTYIKGGSPPPPPPAAISPA